MIVIPAAGRSSRFRKAGYETSKVMLPLGGRTVFDFVLMGFRDHLESEQFVVITGDPEVTAFMEQKLTYHEVSEYQVIEVPCAGMLPNVSDALKRTTFSLDQPMVIHVADVIRGRYTMPGIQTKAITVDFSSAIHAEPTEMIVDPAAVLFGETGLGCYHFASAADFLDVYEHSRSPRVHKIFGEKAMEATEAIKLLQNLSKAGYAINMRFVPHCHVNPCGHPKEYRLLEKLWEPRA